MTSREQTLALLLIGVMVVTVGAVGGYLLVLSPLQQNRADSTALQAEIADLEAQQRNQVNKSRDLARLRARSLPADEAFARREYDAALRRLLDAAGATDRSVTPRPVDNTNRSVPEISKGKPVYAKVAFEVVIKKADMWVVKDFLKGYYGLNLLHQITNFSIKKDEETTRTAGRRNDLTVTFTTEAVIVDGADARKTLVSPAVNFGPAHAAVGGGAMYQHLARSPALAPEGRDYSLMVLKDPFNGPLPQPPAFKLSPIKDVVVKQDERSSVKVAVSGEGAQGTTLRAVAAGPLFPEGELKVDPKTLAIELPRTSAAEGTATVSVYATSADGKTEQTAFKVSVEKKPEAKEVVKEDTRPDVSAAIRLTMVTFREDGSAWARIFDSACQQRYEIDARPGAVSILKEWVSSAKSAWKKDRDYDHPPGVLVLSHEDVKTNRTFKVVGVDLDGLILVDLKGDGAKPKAPPGKFDRWRQGPAAPLSAVAGNMAAGVPLAPPKVYRWGVGKSLAAIEELPAADAKKFLQAENGPMIDRTVFGGR